MQLHTTTIGTGSRSAALVHGLTSWTATWRFFAPILVEQYHCTVTLVDQRGHGDSPRGDHHRVEDFVDDLVETLPTGLDLLIGADGSHRVPARQAAEMRALGWDIRVKRKAVHDVHVQDPAGVAALLDDVLR